MNCDECQSLLIEFACDALAPSQRSEVRRHLEQGCRECQRELDALQESLSAVALTVTPVAPPASVKQDLLARLQAGHDAPRASLPSTMQSAPARRSRFAAWRAVVPYAAVTAGAILAGVFAVQWTDHRLARQEALTREFQLRLAEARRTFPSRGVRVASLGAAQDAAALRCYLILDTLTGELHFHAWQLGQPGTGRQFQLWLVTRDNRFVSLGKLTPDAAGNCAAVFTLPADSMDFTRAVVSEESPQAAPSSSPQGPERLSADFDGDAAP
jgi:anti-sigma-K factor RskA